MFRLRTYTEMYYDQLFERIQRLIAHPRDTLTAHDRCRAALIIRLLHDDDGAVEYIYSTLYDDDGAVEYIYSTLTEEDSKMMKQIRKQVDNKMRQTVEPLDTDDE